MAPPRRVRDEVLTLRKPGLPDRELFRAQESLYDGQFPTQRRFQVSPNAHVLAYKSPSSNDLHLVGRGASGTVHYGAMDEFRFSPDGQSLASVAWQRQVNLDVLDLHSWRVKQTNSMLHVSWIEYCRDGVVALQYEKWDAERTLTLVAADGSTQSIASIPKNVRRFVASKADTRIAYFVGGQVWSISVGGSVPELVAKFDQDITNAEMAPDGRSLIVLTDKEAYLLRDGDKPREIGVSNAHTVWFSADGTQFVVANADKAHWERGDRRHTLLAEDQGPIRSARFAPTSPWIMVARGRQAVRWNPSHEESDTIAMLDENQEMLGVDVCSSGLVLWSGTKWERFGWGGKRID